MFLMKRIPVPEWARAVTITVEESFGPEQYQAASEKRQEILTAVQQAVEGYVNDDDLDPNLFPLQRKMTGEYYVSHEYYKAPDVQYHTHRPPTRGVKRYLFSINVRCLEKQWIGHQTNFDYLGLEVHFEWTPLEECICFMGVDSSSI